MIRFIRATAPPSAAQDAAVAWPLIAANTANGTLKITIAATATTVRRASTRDSRGPAASDDSAAPATVPSKRADQPPGPSQIMPCVRSVRQNPYLQIRVHWMSRPATGRGAGNSAGDGYDAKRELVRS